MKRVLNLGSLSRIVEGDPNEITESKTGFVTQSGSDVISGDVSKNVTLVANPT